MSLDDLWFPFRSAPRAGALKLFCFPYAGGNAALFRTWPSQLPQGVEVWPVQLPGRATRLQERPLTSVDTATAALVEPIASAINEGPFAFFGHSLGALIAFELSRRLRAEGHAPPVHLFVSACAAPSLERRPATPIGELSDAAFRDRLRALEGTPEAVLDDAEMLALLFPLLRADFTMAQDYRYRAQPPLTCPLTAAGGESDPEVSPAQLEAWGQETVGPFRSHQVPGHHLFILDQPSRLLPLLRAALQLWQPAL